MAGPVKPVIGEIVCEKGQYPVPPTAAIQGEKPQAVKLCEKPEDQGFCDEVGQHIADAQGEAAEGIFYFVEVPLLPVGEPGFQAKQQDETGNSIVENGGRHGQALLQGNKKKAPM